MSKEIILMMVKAGANNNKYYRMLENGDGTWTAEYGREGANPRRCTYSMGLWDRKYREQVNKGYTDITDLKKVSEGGSLIIDTGYSAADALLRLLVDRSRMAVAANYQVSADAVTQQQIDHVQVLLDNYAAQANTQDIRALNKLLEEVFTVLPRKMGRVADYVLPKDADQEKITAILQREQDTLEAMRSSVVVVTGGPDDLNILDMLQLTITPDNTIVTLPVASYSKPKQGFVIEAPWYTAKFQDHVQQADNDTVKVLVHGSRVENWLSILKSGLLIRPAGAVTSGSRFGNGIYFADTVKKSLSYADRPAIIGVYEVHVGSHFKATRTSSNWGLDTIAPHDSTLGYDWSDNNEYIIYRPQQAHIVGLYLYD